MASHGLATGPLDPFEVEPEDRRHRTGTLLPRLEHQRAPPPHQARRCWCRQGSRGDPRRVLAERVTGGRDHVLAEPLRHHGQDGRAVRQDRRLGGVGLGQLFLGALPHHLGERCIERRIDRAEGVGGGRKPIGEVAGHARLLGALTREQQDGHHRSTTLPQVKPAPKATSITIIPGLSRPSASAWTKASGMLAEEVLP